MSVEKLITDNLDIWASAVKAKSASGRGSSNKLELYGIKKLRELILALAVRGKLVPQDPNDEPASKLLERIASEKEQLIKDKKIKKQKPFSTITDEEKPLELPHGWKWARLGDLSSNIHYGYTASAKPENEGIRLLRITDIQDDKVNWETVPGCEITDEKSEGYSLENNDILIARTGGTIGKSYLVENINVKAVFASYLIRVKRISAMYSPFIKTYLGSSIYWSQLYDNASGTGQPNVNATALKQLLVPVAPLNEQKRIVAKVVELMALCDQLEAQTDASIEAHQTLVKTLLETLTNAKDADELDESWLRISEHFDVLFTTEDSIDQLKQTILQLAVMGKLVKQDPNDEPASRLLERIAAEKEQLIKDKKIKKQKPLPPIPDEEKPFEVPGGWDWCRGEMVAEFIDPQPSHRTPPVVTGGVPYVGYTDIDISSGINFESARKVSPSVLIEHRKRYTLNLGDFVFGKIGTLGKPFFLSEPFDYCLSANLILIQPNQNAVVPQFLATFLNSPVLYQILDDQKTNSTHGVFGIKKARLLTVPLPPINEQKRIVVKVETLMTLCDTLKGRLKDEKTIQLHLTDAIAERVS